MLRIIYNRRERAGMREICGRIHEIREEERCPAIQTIKPVLKWVSLQTYRLSKPVLR
jgi:hypothetical protein